MAVTPYELRSYPGAAPDTTLAGGITAAALGFTVQAGTGSGFPDGSAGPFFVVIDYDQSPTEKVHCTARAGDVFTVDVRGADGTTAQAHADQAKVRACWTATDAQEANRGSHYTVGLVTAKGDMISGSAAATLVKTAVGIDGTIWTADSSQPGGARYKAIPTNLNITGGVIDPTTLIDGEPASDYGIIDTTVGDITTSNPGDTGLAGATGKAADAGHKHPREAAPGYPALTLLAGAITPRSTNGTLLSVALTVGTWKFDLSATVQAGLTTSNGVAQLTATGAGGITLTGATTADGYGETLSGVIGGSCAVLTFEAVVATAGSVTVALAVSGTANVTAGGYTALRTA